ncbi:FMN-binding negative transcriptional regulator [Fictibacillus iocasae]|uniref:FMN-binding negative transcriptional regulator n=1 Tax=Fictibacillus iocasae TaxID=2715437 RepID=A0ABW2NM13_9BACL
MYNPKSFREEDKTKLFSFVKENSFGILFSTEEGRAERRARLLNSDKRHTRNS